MNANSNVPSMAVRVESSVPSSATVMPAIGRFETLSRTTVPARCPPDSAAGERDRTALFGNADDDRRSASAEERAGSALVAEFGHPDPPAAHDPAAARQPEERHRAAVVDRRGHR